MKTLQKWEFDSFPAHPTSVEIREGDDGNVSVVIPLEEGLVEVVSSHRDQWGTWITVGGITFGQEDSTRSMLDGIIQALIKVRAQVEYETIPATPDQ